MGNRFNSDFLLALDAVKVRLRLLRDMPDSSITFTVRDWFFDILDKVPERSSHSRIIVAAGIASAHAKLHGLKCSVAVFIGLLLEAVALLRLEKITQQQIRSLEYKLEEAGAELGLGYSQEECDELKEEVKKMRRR